MSVVQLTVDRSCSPDKLTSMACAQITLHKAEDSGNDVLATLTTTNLKAGMTSAMMVVVTSLVMITA